jgi:hypothetical protein
MVELSREKRKRPSIVYVKNHLGFRGPWSVPDERLQIWEQWEFAISLETGLSSHRRSIWTLKEELAAGPQRNRSHVLRRRRWGSSDPLQKSCLANAKRYAP